MKIELVNPQKEVELAVKALQRGEEELALQRLRSIRQRAKNRLSYTEKKLESAKGIEYQILKAREKEQRREYEALKNTVSTVTDYVKNPGDYDYKTSRKNYYKVGRDIQRANAIVAKQSAEKELVRSVAAERGDIVGVSIGNIKKGQKLDALLQNVVYKNKNFNVDKATLERISAEVKEITGYDILADIINAFNTPTHYESGGGKGNIPIYDTFMNVTQKLASVSRGYTASELDVLEKSLDTLRQMFGIGG